MISKEKAIKAQLDLNFLVDKAKFISDGTWFDLNTEATIIGALSPTWDEEDNLVGLALFKGIRQGKPDEEVCSLSEFDVWKEDTKIQKSCKRFMGKNLNPYLRLRYL